MKRVAHVLWRSRGGMRRHVRSIAIHPPPGWTTAGVWGPHDLAPHFDDVPFTGSTLLGLRRALATADVVHAHGVTAGLVGLRPRTTPVVISLHTVFGETGRTASSRVARILAKAIVSRADVVVAVSHGAASGFRDARVVPPVFEPLPPPSRGRDAVRGELGSSDGDVVVVCVARLERSKRLELLIQAVERAGATGWIVGDGTDRERIGSLAAGTRAVLLGYRSDVSDILHAADLFASPSYSESYGFAVAEAVSAGLPVVATATGELEKIVDGAGICVDRDDESGFVDAVARLVADRGERQRFAERARAMSGPDDESARAALGDAYDAALMRRKLF